MTQPTIEQISQEIIDHMGSYLEGNILLIQENAVRHAVKQSPAIRAALTAQGLPEDGNRLPLEEIPEGLEFRLSQHKHSGSYSCTLFHKRSIYAGGRGGGATPAEALRAAIAAAEKDGAG